MEGYRIEGKDRKKREKELERREVFMGGSVAVSLSLCWEHMVDILGAHHLFAESCKFICIRINYYYKILIFK